MNPKTKINVLRQEATMVNFQLEIITEDGIFRVGPFDTNAWPTPGETLTVNLLFRDTILKGPVYDVTECNRDEKLVTVKRHQG